MFDGVKADAQKVLGKQRTVVDKLGHFFFNSGLHAVLLYRLASWLYHHRMAVPATVVGYVNSTMTGAQISPRATIGKGLAIIHPQGTVVGATAVIGDDCTLIHGNVIGQVYGTEDRPVIGHRLMAGSGAKILGRIVIGDDVIVGANSVVIQSLPDNVTVFGVPARIIFPVRAAKALAPAGTPTPEMVLERLVSLLKRNVKMISAIDALDESTELIGAGVGMDSLEMLKVVCAIEEEFTITIDDAELGAAHFRTVGCLVRFIAAQIAGS